MSSVARPVPAVQPTNAASLVCLFVYMQVLGLER